jgi:ABC-2 type transport system ATP-binding protein
MIEVQHLTKRYGTVSAINDISFTAKKNEIVGLLGPNGAGKTTTMRVITGFMPPTEGTVKVCGFDVTEDSIEARRKVGYLPERVPLYPDMTVFGFVEFWAKLRGVSYKKAQVNEILEKLQLIARRSQLIRHLSKGLRQRVGLAQAMIHNPEVLILDEPTIGIDPQQVIEVRELVRSLKQDHTVLFSSHILSEVEQVCDRVVIISRGRIVGEGTTASLSKSVAENQQVFVIIKGANDQTITSKLSKIPHLKEIRAMDDGFVINAQTTEDIRPFISQVVAQESWTLLEMRSVEVSLEDIFLNLVK